MARQNPMLFERRYSSSRIKLLKHLDRLEEIKIGRFRPITLQVAPTDKCQLSCGFCSVKNRKMEVLLYQRFPRAFDDLYGLGLIAVEITGGGEPTLYPRINDMISLISREELDVGLITNGLSLDRLTDESLGCLQWVRVSLNGLDQGKDPSDYAGLGRIVNMGATLGFSYVWNDMSTADTLLRIQDLCEEYDSRFLRIVPDCLSVEGVERAKREVPAILSETFDGKPPQNWFLQSKSYEKPERCWYGYLKPFLNCDGYFYHCSANPLLERRFHPGWRMGRAEDASKIWGLNPQPFNTENCGLCFFREQNELLEEVLTEVEHPNFI